MLNWLEKQGFLVLDLFTAWYNTSKDPEVSLHTSFTKLGFLLSSLATTVLELLALHHLHHLLHSGVRDTKPYIYRETLRMEPIWKKTSCLENVLTGKRRQGTHIKAITTEPVSANPSLQCLMFNVSVFVVLLSICLAYFMPLLLFRIGSFGLVLTNTCMWVNG